MRGKSKFFFWTSLPGRFDASTRLLPVSYPCLSPGCEAQFPHEALLEQHMACHFGPSHGNADGALSRYSNQNSGDCHEAVDATTGFAPCAGPSVPQVGNDLYCPAIQQELRTALVDGSIPTSSANAKKSYYCRDRGCNMGFNHSGDVKRHERTHYATGKVKILECPDLGCNRKGEWGFMRRDKLVDHIRAKHKRSVGRNDFRGSNNYPSTWAERVKWLKANGFDRWGLPISDVSE